MDWLRELGALADITKSARSRIFEKVEKRREDLRRRKIIELKPPPPPPPTPYSYTRFDTQFYLS